MNWLMKVVNAVFTKKKIMMWIAAVVVAGLAAVFGISPQEIKDAVQEAPVIELPTSTPPTK